MKKSMNDYMNEKKNMERIYNDLELRNKEI